MNPVTLLGRTAPATRAAFLIGIGASLAITAVSMPAAPAWAEPTLSGRVVDYNGNPVPFADLDFFNPVSGAKVDPTPPGAPPQSDKTDLTGRYSHVVIPDVYHVRFQPPVSRTDLATVLLRSVTMDVDKLIDVTLPLGYAVSGSVRAPDGSPVVGADLDVTNESTGERVPTPGDATGGSGAYRVVIEPGTYTIFISPPDGSRLVPAAIAGVIVAGPTTLDVTLENGLILSGSVQDESGLPLGGSDIDIDDRATGERVWNPADETTPDGAFRLAMLAGSYDLSFHAPPGAELASAIVRDVSVAADRAMPPVTLVPGVRVASRVLGGDGFPLPGAKVVAFEDTSGLRYPTPDAVADSAGELIFRVPVGDYRLVIAPPAGSGLDSLAAGAFAFASDTTIVLSYVEARFVSLVARLAVAGAPAQGRVSAWPSPRSGDPVAVADADASGDARLTLPAGVYDLLVQPNDDLEPDSLFAAGISLDNDTTVVFEFIAPPPPPERGALTLSLPRPNPFALATRIPISAAPEAALRARVHDLSGRLVHEAALAADAGGGVEFVWDGRDSDGGDVPAGVYSVLVEGGGGSAAVRVIRVR